MPAAALPLDLLAHVLHKACEELDCKELDTQQRLACLVQLACVCRHWQAAAGLAATDTRYRAPGLGVRCLTPLLSDWAASWTGLSLQLDKHGVPPGLQTFMRSCTALHQVILQVSGNSGAQTMQTDIEAVQHSLAVIPALRTLCCLSHVPMLLQTLTSSSWLDLCSWPASAVTGKRQLVALPGRSAARSSAWQSIASCLCWAAGQPPGLV